MMRRFKNESFFWFKKLKKTKNWRCKKATKKVQKKKNQKHLYPEGRKNGTRKDMCSKMKKRRKQTEKGKRKMKNRIFF